MKKVQSLRLLILLFTLAIFGSCQKQVQDRAAQSDPLTNVTALVILPAGSNTGISTEQAMNKDYNSFYGPAVQMGNGHARSWINITRIDNKPLAIGIEFTGSSFNGLPTDPMNFPANIFVLPLHQKARAVTPFDHITLNWEPAGHEPPGIYNVPHFDMHFYKITVADQNNITGIPGPPPPPGYLPASYVIEAATVPQMGTHWLDPSSPELPPILAPFTHTFIYGSTGGHVHFMEPMITTAFLLSGATVAKAIPQATLFSPSNTYYPAEYNIWKNESNGRHYVAMSNFSMK